MHFASQDSENTPGTVQENKRVTLEQLIDEVSIEGSAGTIEPKQTKSSPAPPPQPKPSTAVNSEISNEQAEASVPLSSKLLPPRTPLGYRAPSRSTRIQQEPSNSALNFTGTIGAPQAVDQIVTNIEPSSATPSEPNPLPLEESKETPINPPELLETMMQSPHEETVFQNLKRFLSEFAHKPLIESESGVVAFVAREENDRHIRVFVGSMRDFCLMSGDDDSIEGQLTIDEVFEYDEEENQPLMIIRKTSQQLAPSIAGRKTFLVLEFKGSENGPGAATHSVKKEWH